MLTCVRVSSAATRIFCLFLLSFAGLQGAQAQVDYLHINGNYSYEIDFSAGSLQLHVDQISNTSSTWTTGTLQIQLWATDYPYSGGSINGYVLGTHTLGGSSGGTLGPNQYFSDINATVPIQSVPPNGNYYVTLTVNEYSTSCGSNDGFCIDTFGGFPNLLTVGDPGGNGSEISLAGTASYVIDLPSATAALHVDEIRNSSATYTSGTLQIQLWATTYNYSGGTITGFPLATYTLQGSSNGTLGPNQYFSNVQATVPLDTWLSPGTYFMTMTVNEYATDCASASHFCIEDFVTLPLLTVGTVNPTGINVNQHGLTGTWTDANHSGQGLVIETLPDFYSIGTGLIFGGWYTYDVSAAGGKRWYSIQGTVDSATGSATFPIFETSGGVFDAPGVPVTAAIGEANLVFSDCTHGLLTYAFYDGSGRSGSVFLDRILANVSCGEGGDTNFAPPDYLWSGTWADSNATGQGLLLEVNSVQGYLFGGWYTYGANSYAGDGPQGHVWFTLQSVFDSGQTYIPDVGIYETSGGAFNAPDPTTTVQAGSASMLVNSCGSITVYYTFNAGTNAGRVGILDLHRVTGIPAGCSL